MSYTMQGVLCMKNLKRIIFACLLLTFIWTNVLAESTINGSQEEQMKPCDKAHEHYKNNDTKSVSDEIKECVAVMEKEAGIANKEGKRIILVSVNELKKLGHSLENGVKGSEEKVKQTFEKAHAVMQKHHQQKVSEKQYSAF